MKSENRFMFIGQVRHEGEIGWRGAPLLLNRHPAYIEENALESRLFESEFAAREWLRHLAYQRGFNRIHFSKLN